MRKKQKQYKPSGIAPFMMTAGALVAVMWLASSSEDFGTVHTGAKTEFQSKVFAAFIDDKLAGKPSKRSAPPEQPTRTEEPDDAPIPPPHQEKHPVQQVEEVPDALVKAIEMVESSGNPHAVSKTGARGYMQITQVVAKHMNCNRDKPAENRKCGEKYLNWLVGQLHSETYTTMAYYWGIGNLKAWLARGGKLKQVPGDVRDYLQKVDLARAKIEHNEMLIAQN